MNLEEIFTTLRAASGGVGIKYEIIQNWFEICKIIDGKLITRDFFTLSYERLCPNREELSLVQFAQLVGILSRHSKQEVEVLAARFKCVNEVIIDEIRQARRLEEFNRS